MKAILFSPHNDDETLFAFYQCLRLKPIVVIVLRSFRQHVQQDGPIHVVREAETVAAMEIAGVPALYQWEHLDLDPPWDRITVDAVELVRAEKPDLIVAPMWEPGGHEDHNNVAAMAHYLCFSFPASIRLVRYLTYRRGHGRSMNGQEVVAADHESSMKLRALECYQSQAEHPPTAPWFNPHQHGDLREWIA